MLEGITVLNESEVTELVDWFGLSMIIGIILMAVIFAVGLSRIDKWWGLALTIIAAIMVVCLMVFAGIQPQEPTGRYRYECLIDESVSMKEVYERYEIIEQRGDIWVLEDKE